MSESVTESVTEPVTESVTKPAAGPGTEPAGASASSPALTKGLVMLFAFCCGAIVANIYYAQPLIELIAPAVGLSAGMASLIVSLTQVGYALGLLFLVPLGDLLENRRLMVTTLVLSIGSLTGAAMSHGASAFLACSMLIGITSVSVQMMVPIAAHMADNANRGRVVGTVMSGLLFGILLSRPVASVVADHFGWRAVFGGAAVLMALIAILLATNMPRRQPGHTASYGQLLRSLATLLRTQPVLRRRSLYQALMFGSMALFWTAAPIELARHFGFSQSRIAIFALVGAAGAFAAPVTGRLADAGHGKKATGVALALAGLSYLPSLLHPAFGVIGLGITAVLLDLSVQMSMVVGQREVYALDPASRSRLNSVYMTSIFVGGAIGAAVASPLYDAGGWRWVGSAGVAFSVLVCIRFWTDHARGTSRELQPGHS